MRANPQAKEQTIQPRPLRIVKAGERKDDPGVSIHLEIENIRRIVNGANKRLERLCEQIAEK